MWWPLSSILIIKFYDVTFSWWLRGTWWMWMIVLYDDAVRSSGSMKWVQLHFPIMPCSRLWCFCCYFVSFCPQLCPSPCPEWSVNTLHIDFSSKLKSLVDKKQIYSGNIRQGFGQKIPLNEYLVIFDEYLLNEWWVISCERMLLFSYDCLERIPAPCIHPKSKPHRPLALFWAKHLVLDSSSGSKFQLFLPCLLNAYSSLKLPSKYHLPCEAFLGHN